ncbi:MAG: hypothetical protein JW759_04150 [Candidatus Coatesbacteria bacterium]|nr:hypothetical protein [Candidatus Coatesbacteria bacterium]
MKVLRFFCVFALFTVVSAALALGMKLPSLDEKAWTIILYMSADNSLSDCAPDDINEVEAAIESVDANVLILVDQSGNNDTRAYRAEYDPLGPQNGPLVSEQIPLGDIYVGWDGQSELNLAKPDTLLHFCQWAINSYPAEHSALVLWDHGDGWRRKLAASRMTKDICYDGYDSLDISQLKAALSALQQNTGRTLDIIGMDACLMGMVEVAYQLKDLCEVVIASEESVPWDGWDYSFLSELRPGADTSAKELAVYIVDYFCRSYTDGAPYPTDDSYVVLSAVDVTSFEDGFVSALEKLAQLLIASMEQSKRKVRDAYVSSCRMEDYWYYVDFKDFMLALEHQNISEAVTNAARDAASEHDELVFHHRAGEGLPYCYGLSIYFESDEQAYDERYDGQSAFLDFTADTLWDEVLRSFYNPGEMAPKIEFEPHPDTEASDEEIHISCFIDTELPLAEAALYFKVERASRSGDDYASISLERGLLPEEYVATIPGQPNNTHVFYYIYAENIAGTHTTSPPGAPDDVHGFWVRTDTTAPSIEHSPLGRQPAGRESVEVTCVVRDNLGVDDNSVKLYYHSGDQNDMSSMLEDRGASTYSGEIPTAGLVPGDRIWYRLEASDVARTPNQARLPEEGYFMVSLIPSLGSVLLIDDNSGDSAGIFHETLEAAGYVVITHTPGGPPLDAPFDIVVYCLGDASEPVPAYHTGLVDYVLAGGRMLIESGDLAWSACQKDAATLADLRQFVLHIDSWKADYGDILVLRNPEASLATTPHILDSTVGFLGEFLSTRDVCVPAADAGVLYNWSRYSQPGLIYFDDNGDDADGGQIVYMTFAVPYLSDDAGQRTQLIENCAYYLSDYVRDNVPPALSELSPHTGATVPPNSTLSFKLADSGTGIDRSTVELWLNGASVMVKSTILDAEHLIFVSYSPADGFVPETRYDISIAACDFVGNRLSDDSHWFQTSGTPGQTPMILAGGFLQSQVLGPGNALQVVAMPRAFGDGNAVESVELMFDGLPLGVFLNDEGNSGDAAAGDGIYSTLLQVPTQLAPGQYKLQIVASDKMGQTSWPWPDLHVTE